MAYNLAVGAAGMTSIIAVYMADLLTGHRASIPWVGMLVFGILANLCYCLGPLVDTIVMRTWGRDYSEVGPTIFRYGFVFAVGLSLLPVPLVFLRVILGLLF